MTKRKFYKALLETDPKILWSNGYCVNHYITQEKVSCYYCYFSIKGSRGKCTFLGKEKYTKDLFLKKLVKENPWLLLEENT